MEILTERFGNKQLIISSHMEALLQLPAVTVITDIKRIRMIYDKVEANVRGLEALGIASDTYDSLLVPVMMNKLPEELRLIITRRFEGGIWHLDKLLKSFKEEVEARERRSFMSRPNERGSESKKARGQGLPTAATLVSSTDGPNQGPPTCGNQHPYVDCPVAVDVPTRLSILRKKGKYYVCLRAHHLSRTCQSKLRCKECGGRQHVSICGRATPTAASQPGMLQFSLKSRPKRSPTPSTTRYWSPCYPTKPLTTLPRTCTFPLRIQIQNSWKYQPLKFIKT